MHITSRRRSDKRDKQTKRRRLHEASKLKHDKTSNFCIQRMCTTRDSLCASCRMVLRAWVGGDGHGWRWFGSSRRRAIWCSFFCLAFILPLVNLENRTWLLNLRVETSTDNGINCASRPTDCRGLAGGRGGAYLCLAAMHRMWSSKMNLAARRGVAGRPQESDEADGRWMVMWSTRESSLSPVTSRSCQIIYIKVLVLCQLTQLLLGNEPRGSERPFVPEGTRRTW